MKSALAAISIAFCISGCSTYPLPQDATGDDTVAIISKVRCEVGKGLREILFRILREENGSKVVYEESGRARTGADVADEIFLGKSSINSFKLGYFRSDLRDAFKYYSTAAVGYEFTLDLTETNAQGLNLAFTRNIPLPSGSIGVGARADRTRQVIRTFRIIDTFDDLSKNYGENFCNLSSAVDIIYPIRSSKPIYDLLDSFIHANEFLNLKGDKEQAAVNKMTDTIEFTTKLTGNLEPTFTPGISGPGFFLTSIGVINNATRSDRHKVILTLTVAPKRDPERNYGNGVSIIRNSRSKAWQIDYANRALDEQRVRNTQDAIIQFGQSFSRLVP